MKTNKIDVNHIRDSYLDPIPIRDEVIQEITESGLKLIEDQLQSEICIESEAVINKCAECRFWVVKK